MGETGEEVLSFWLSLRDQHLFSVFPANSEPRTQNFPRTSRTHAGNRLARPHLSSGIRDPSASRFVSNRVRTIARRIRSHIAGMGAGTTGSIRPGLHAAGDRAQEPTSLARCSLILGDFCVAGEGSRFVTTQVDRLKVLMRDNVFSFAEYPVASGLQPSACAPSALQQPHLPRLLEFLELLFFSVKRRS
jgi:hypothetical protein